MAHRGAASTGPFRRGAISFSRWRRSRPFWGGLLVILGAAVILLSERGPLPLIIHIGLQGLAGYVVPVIILLAGALLLFHPVQRIFYSLIAVIFSLGSFITSNLGGFFVGMVLALLGGSLAFAWEPPGGQDQPKGQVEHAAPVRRAAGLELIWGQQARPSRLGRRSRRR